MAPLEFREHHNKLRTASRANESAQKKRRIREKDCERKRRKRQEQAHLSNISLNVEMGGDHEPAAPTENAGIETTACNEDAPVKLSKSDYNFTSKLRKVLASRAKTPQKFARLVRNVAANTRSPRKKKALAEEGLVFSTATKRKEKSQSFFKRTVTAARKLFRQRKPRKDAISQQVKQQVRVFYTREDISRALPHKRYATKHGPAFVMQQTLRAAFSLFRAENPEVKIGYVKFTQCRPRNVKKISAIFSESCLCVYCLNIRLKVLALNRAVSSQRLDASLRVQDETGLMKLLLCERSGDRFHKPSCLQGQCEKCSDLRRTLNNHYAQLLDSGLSLTWNRWTRQTVEGKTTREPVTKCLSVEDLLEELVEDLEKPVKNTTFVQHLFVAHWQYHQHRQLKENLKTGEVMLVMDFAENRSSKYQDEIKSAHYSKRQITLHPVVAFYHDQQSGELVRHALDFLSDDVDHDFNAVHHFTLKTIEFLEGAGVLHRDKTLYIFSDGCASQYKGKGTFVDLSHYSRKVERIYYGSEHGKGEADGETGAISQALERAVLCRTVSIRNAADLYKWAAENLAKDERLSKRTFFFVGPNDIKRGREQTAIKTIAGCRKFHQVVKVAPLVLKARHLACFCSSCQDGTYNDCINKQHVGLFKIYQLQQLNDEDRDDPSSPLPPQSSPSPVPSPPPSSPVPPPPSAPGVAHRKSFFKTYQNKLVQAKAQGFNHFVQCAQECLDQAQRFPLEFPDHEPAFERRSKTDTTAEALRPQDHSSRDRFAKQTIGDGNCLPRALSAAIFKNEHFHVELRVRIVCELAINKNIYLSPDTISKGTDLDGCDSTLFFHQSGDFPLLNMFEAFKQETMASASNSIDLGPWQMLAAATVLQRTVVSVFPEKGSAEARQELHRPFLPVSGVGPSTFPVYIMWTSNREDLENVSPDLWLPNHFVPLVLDKDFADIHNTAFCEANVPNIGDFVRVVYTVRGKDIVYMAMVIPPVPGLKEGEFFVKFFRKSGAFFVFPSTDDCSVISHIEAKIDVVDPPTINGRGHHFF